MTFSSTLKQVFFSLTDLTSRVQTSQSHSGHAMREDFRSPILLTPQFASPHPHSAVVNATS